MATNSRNRGNNISIGEHTTEAVTKLKYLDSAGMAKKNNIGEEVCQRILSANKCFSGIKKHMRSQTLTKPTSIHRVLTYGAEKWATTRNRKESYLS